MTEADREEIARVRDVATRAIQDAHAAATASMARYGAIADMLIAQMQMLVGIVLENGDKKTCEDVRRFLQLMNDRLEQLIPPNRIH